ATGALFRSFQAYPGFTGAVAAGAGDINHDGKDDIITIGANGRVKAFDGATGVLFRSFLAYGRVIGAVAVGSGDINNDGFDDIITGANGRVKVFSGATG